MVFVLTDVLIRRGEDGREGGSGYLASVHRYLTAFRLQNDKNFYDIKLSSITPFPRYPRSLSQQKLRFTEIARVYVRYCILTTLTKTSKFKPEKHKDTESSTKEIIPGQMIASLMEITMYPKKKLNVRFSDRSYHFLKTLKFI